MKKYYRKVQIALAIYILLIGLSAIAGSYGLIFMNGLGMQIESLHGYFPSFFVPGLILGFIVGGTHLFASYQLIKNQNFAPEASAIAGFGLIIWVYTEIYIIQQAHWLQAVYFALGIITLFTTMGLYKFRK